MKKFYFLIVLALILGLVLTGCLLSNVGQVPTNDQSGISYLTKSPSPDLVGLWHFDEGIGTTANDSSVNSNDGTVYGATWVADQWGGYALSFDGVDDYVDIYDSGSLDITGPITVEAWVKFNTAAMGKDSVIARKWNAYSLQKYTDNKLEGWVNIGGTWYGVRGITGGTALISDQWYHLAFTYDSTNVRTYVNGSLDRVGAVTGNIDATAGNASIGTDLEGHHAYTAGIIDEVRIWDTAYAGFEVSATPKVDFNPVETEHKITATIDPVAPGVTVGLEVVDGPNEGATASDQTDAGGQVTLSYIGSLDDGKDIIRIWVDRNWNGSWDEGVDYAVTVEKYWLENFVTGGGKINMSTLGLNGKKPALTFGGTVGVMADASIVGQFQIVDHTGLIRKGAVSWHCNNNFSFLNFEGDPAESPEATHNTAIFEGEFTNNLGDTETLRLRLIDNGEPGAGNDTFSLWLFGDWVELTIDGGNFQVHDIEG